MKEIINSFYVKSQWSFLTKDSTTRDVLPRIMVIKNLKKFAHHNLYNLVLEWPTRNGGLFFVQPPGKSAVTMRDAIILDCGDDGAFVAHQHDQSPCAGDGGI